MGIVLQSLIKCDLIEIGTNTTLFNLVELAEMTFKASNKILQRPQTHKSCFCCTPFSLTFQEYFRPRWVLFCLHSLSNNFCFAL